MSLVHSLKTEAFEQSRRERKRVEMLFAHLKRILRLGRLRLRGPRGATGRVHARGHRPEPASARQARRQGRRLRRPGVLRESSGSVEVAWTRVGAKAFKAAAPAGASGKKGPQPHSAARSCRSRPRLLQQNRHRAEDFRSCSKRDSFPGVQETRRERRRNARP